MLSAGGARGAARGERGPGVRASWRVAVVAFELAGAAFGCSRQDPDAVAWRGELLASRAAKDAFLRGDESPLPPSPRAAFAGLEYFDPDPRFRVDATFTPATGSDTVYVATSAATHEAYLRHGVFAFTLGRKSLRFVCYRAPESGALFVPFTDATSNHATYGGGRYLDPEMTSDGSERLDFNRAYNPYCAYAPGWVCPLPPAENHLEVEIRAGEKAMRGH